jgi:hypothetical protein
MENYRYVVIVINRYVIIIDENEENHLTEVHHGNCVRMRLRSLGYK